MKKTVRIVLLLTVALAMLLVACQTAPDTTTAPATDPATDAPTVTPTTPPTAEPSTAPSTEPPVTESYTVTFKGKGVSTKAQTVKSGEFATKPADPFWEGGDFVEWQLDGVAYDFENTPVTSDITLTAAYTLYEYNIRFFDENDKQIGETQVLHYGDKATVPAYTPADGKVFSEWRNKDRTAPRDPAEAVTMDISYYAYCLSYYNVTFKLEDGTVLAENMKVMEGTYAIPPMQVVGEGDDAVGYLFVPATPDEWKVTGDTVFTLREDQKFLRTAMPDKGHAANGGTTTNGATANPAYVLMSDVGTFCMVTADEYAAGLFYAYIKMVENTPDGYSVVVEVKVDDIVVNRITVNNQNGGYIPLAALSKGAHTVTWTVVETKGDKGDGWLGLLCSAYRYSRDLSGVNFSVIFKGEDGETIRSDSSPYGSVITPPEMAEKLPDGRTFEGWFNEAGEALAEGQTVTDASVWTARYSILHKVTYKTADGEIIATVNVNDGDTAALPTSDTYYYTAPLSELINIRADKEIVVTAVEKSRYNNDAGKLNQVSLSLNAGMTDENKEKYSYSTDASVKNYGTIFYKAGQKLTFTVDCVEDIKLYCNVDNTGRRFVLDITVDGVAYTTLTLDTASETLKGQQTICTNLPAGTHTVTVTVTEATGDGLNSWSGLNISSAYFNEARAEESKAE